MNSDDSGAFPGGTTEPAGSATWDGSFPQHGEPTEPLGSPKRPWRWAAGIAVVAVIAAGLGFLAGSWTGGDEVPARPLAAEPGTPTGFDTRTQGRAASGGEIPFVNIRYYGFDVEPTRDFEGRCGYDALLFVLGDFTPCDWALDVLNVFTGYDADASLGYEPSFTIDGVDVYCHYQNPGIMFTGDTQSKGFPVWECRADGGRQFVFAGLTMSMIPPGECWEADGSLRADMSMFTGSPAKSEIPRTKPDWPTLIRDCGQ